MNTPDYDILVVGAGPAGASAAAAAARKKLRVLMIDRRKVVGLPVQCAEYIPALLVGELDIARNFIVPAGSGNENISCRPGSKRNAVSGVHHSSRKIRSDACTGGMRQRSPNHADHKSSIQKRR